MSFANNRIRSPEESQEIKDHGKWLAAEVDLRNLKEPNKDYVITAEHLNAVVTLLNNINLDVTRAMAFSLTVIPELDEYYTKDEVKAMDEATK